jgi:hypothetical protein
MARQPQDPRVQGHAAIRARAIVGLVVQIGHDFLLERFHIGWWQNNMSVTSVTGCKLSTTGWNLQRRDL